MSDVELLLRAEAARVRAPERLRERVLNRAAAAPAPRIALPPLRRLMLVGAPVAVAAIAAAAIVNGVLRSGPTGSSSSSGGATAGAPTVRGDAEAAKPAPPVFRAHEGADRAPFGPAAQLPAAGGRLTDYQATLLVRVRDLDRLTAATAEAVRVVRGLGGYAASIDTTTGRGPGRSYLELRVPASHVQDALLRLSGLGTVLSQQLSQRDLEAVVARQNAQLAALRRTVRRIQIALRNSDLPADARVRLEIQLDEAKRALRQRVSARKATLREAATAKVSMELTTERSAASPPEQGRFGRSLDGSLGFLAATGALALAILVGGAPFLLLAGLAFAVRRAWRRREERRLLAAQ